MVSETYQKQEREIEEKKNEMEEIGGRIYIKLASLHYYETILILKWNPIRSMKTNKDSLNATLPASILKKKTDPEKIG